MGAGRSVDPVKTQLASGRGVISLRPLMKLSPLFFICSVALLMNACEQHPLPGQPPEPSEEHHGAGHQAEDQHSKSGGAVERHAGEAKAHAPAPATEDSTKPAGSLIPAGK